MANISVREFLKNLEAGAYNDESTSVQCDAGWYDWFCRATSLRGKTRVLGRKVAKLAQFDKFDLDTTYVFFKNNCPVYGNLYDSFSICDLKTDNVMFWFCPSNGHDGPDKGKSEYTDFTRGGAEFKFDSWGDLVKHFVTAK
jgi:hypothetical protein